MNDAQHRKYCICAAQAVKAMRKLGHTGTDQELRRRCRVQALGQDKDSRRLNNKEFDRVLGVLAGYHSMGNLAEQLRVIEQPKLRAMTAAEPYLDEIGIEHDRRERYVATIYERVQAKRPERKEHVYALEEIPDGDITLILAALKHTAEHKHGIEHNHPQTGRGPRSRHAHRVGHRRRDAEPPKTAPEAVRSRITADEVPDGGWF